MKDIANTGGQGVPRFGLEAVGGSERVEAGPEEGFIGVDVADAGEHGLVEQDGLDGASRSARGVGEHRAFDDERVGPERLPGDRAEALDGADGTKAAEATWIAEEHDRIAGVDGPHGMHMSVDGHGVRIVDDEHLSAHAELDDEAATVVGDDGELLATTFERGDGGVLKHRGGPIAEGSRRGRADVGAQERRMTDVPAEQARFQGSSQRFDFRKFWHGQRRLDRDADGTAAERIVLFRPVPPRPRLARRWRFTLDD